MSANYGGDAERRERNISVRALWLLTDGLDVPASALLLEAEKHGKGTNGGGPASPLDALYRDMHPKARAKPKPPKPIRTGEADGENESGTQTRQPGGKLTMRAQVRRTSGVDATERHERQIAALARLIRDAAIRRRDRRRRT